MRGFMIVMLIAAAITACKRNTPPATAGAVPPVSQAAPSGATVKGRILERLEAPPYTYFRLQIGQEEQWAAVPENSLKVGQDVTLANPMAMTNFESKSLKRNFPTILFANIAGDAPTGTSPGNVALQHAQTTKGPDVGDTRTPKATGADAKTVAETHAQKESLKEKTVSVRGKVVKFNAQILGRNWIHLRDGSGSADKGDHDLTVTTAETAAVGDVVTVRGILRLDKDFGSGYRYPVIIEDAKLQK
jgi:hypothetical protein